MKGEEGEYDVRVKGWGKGLKGKSGKSLWLAKVDLEINRQEKGSREGIT
jgi:hypothetical protein